ncbi:MAG: terminase large subunit, partial [Actinobacteria bacterium]|nr:terminase large subunit [Actinomycetota bacterium]
RTPEPEFRTKRCNQWVSSKNAWLPAGVWETLQADVVVPFDAEIVLGVDGSFSGDTTAIVGVTVPKSQEDKPHVFLVEAWEKQPNDSDDWRVDTIEVEERIKMFCSEHPNVKEIAFDPFRWQRSMQVLMDFGLPVVEWPSTSARRMIPATQKVFDSVTEASLTHDGNPLLARHIDNCVLKVDNLGARIVKESRASNRRIDAAVAFVIAYDRATSKLNTDVLPEFFF